MAKGASFDREMRDNAKSEGVGLLSLTIDTDTGKWECWTKMPHQQARNFWRFLYDVRRGMDPKEAAAKNFKETEE